MSLVVPSGEEFVIYYWYEDDEREYQRICEIGANKWDGKQEYNNAVDKITEMLDVDRGDVRRDGWLGRRRPDERKS